MTNERGSCLTKRLGAEGMPELTAKRIPGGRCCPLTHANPGVWHRGQTRGWEKNLR